MMCFPNTKKLAPLLVCMLWTILVLVIPACGGGTQGTGVRSFEGTIIDPSTGLGLDGVSVTILESGDSTDTTDGGKFVLSAAADAESISFVLDGPSGSAATTATQSITVAAPVFIVQIVFNTASQSAEVTRFEPVMSTPIPTASTTATPISSATPTTAPQPTAVATATNTPLAPTGTPLASPSPTPTPSAYTICLSLDIDGDSVVTVIDLQLANNRYQAGDFDFNHDGTTTAADISAYFTLFNQYTDVDCSSLGR